MIQNKRRPQKAFGTDSRCDTVCESATLAAVFLIKYWEATHFIAWIAGLIELPY